MYVPKPFEVADRHQLLTFARANNFATLVTHSEGLGLNATHVPVLVDEVDTGWIVTGHIARANPQPLGGPALVIFSGPHAYVSPNWYAQPNHVPTWDYVAVHVSGSCSAITDEDELTTIVDRLTAQHEATMPSPWKRKLPRELEARLLANITGFRIVTTDIRGSWKLHQHHAEENKRGIVAALRERGSEDERVIADLIERTIG